MSNRLGTNDPIYDASRLNTAALGGPLSGNFSGDADATYLRLDATNDPVTGAVDIESDSAHALRVLTEGADFPSTAVLDNFDRTDSSPLDGDWDLLGVTGATDPDLVSDHVEPSGDFSAALYSGLTPAADCEVWATVPIVPDGQYDGVVLLARMNFNGGTTWEGYGLWLTQISGVGVIRLVGMQIEDGGYSVSVIGTFSTNASLTNGDGIGLQVIGDELSAWYKPATETEFTFIGSATDTYNQLAGQIGIGLIGVGLDAGLSEVPVELDDFAGGDTTAAAQEIFNVDSLVGLTTTRQLAAMVSTGTSPLLINSQTLVANLNADLLDGHHASYFQTTLSFPLSPTLGGTGINNGAYTLTISGNSTINGSLVGNISGGGTFVSGGFTGTLPKTGTLPVGTGTAGRIAEWVTDVNTLQASTLIKSGAGVLTLAAASDCTVTIPATGTAALKNINNSFSAPQTINTGSAYPSLALISNATGGGDLILEGHDSHWELYVEGTQLRLYTGSDKFFWNTAGQMSIGAAPTFNNTLEIRGSLRAYNTGDSVYNIIDSPADKESGFQFINASTFSDWFLYRPANTTDIRFYDRTADRFCMKQGGNAGFGTLLDGAGVTYYPLNINGSQLFVGADSTQESPMLQIVPSYATDTHASYKARAVVSIWDIGGARSALQIDTDGSTADVLIDSLIYGSMYADDITQAVTVASANVYYKVPGSMTVGLCNGFTLASSRELTCTVAGTYHVVWGMSITSATNNENISGAAMVNTTEVHTSEGSAQCINSSKPVHVSGSAFVALAVNDVLALCVQNEDAAHDITVYHANISAVRIGA